MINEVKPGEKFAIFALKTRTRDLPSTVQLSPAVTVTTSPPVALEFHWRESLGTIRAERFTTAHLFLLATAPSKRPQVLDDENEALRERLWRVLFGLLIEGTITFESPDVLLGAYGDYGLSIRRVLEYRPARPILGVVPDSITENALQKAWKTAEAIERWNSLGPAWRINHALRIFAEARTEPEIPERVHQFCRCIEGFILPAAGDTKRRFKSRTELFIGTGSHDVIGDIYDVRSAVEHLNYQRIGERARRPERLERARQAAIMEALARHCIFRLLSNTHLWPHFRTDDSLAAFWRLPESERRSLWGPSVALVDLVSEFNADWISDFDLGLA